MGRRKQFEPLAIVACRDYRHLAPPDRIISQVHCAGRPDAFNLKSGDPAAEFGWQRKRDLGGERTALKFQVSPGKRAVYALWVAAFDGQLTWDRAIGKGSSHQRVQDAIVKPNSLNRHYSLAALENAQITGGLERLNQLRAAFKTQTI